MDNLELLISLSREQTGNIRYSSDSGVSQRVYTQFFQNAQDLLFKTLINSKCKQFIDPVLMSVIGQQEFYEYPDNIYLQAIDTMEWSGDNGQTWIFFERNIIKDRTTSISGYPYGYICLAHGFLLTPPIEYGLLRISQTPRRAKLERKSALISSVTGSPITSITIDPAYLGTDPAYIAQFPEITIVDKFGNTKVSSVPITAVSPTAITINNLVLPAGVTIIAGDYVLARGDSANVAELPNICESFLVLYANYQAKYGDASQWTKAVLEDVSNQLKELVAAFTVAPDDIAHVPIINTDFLALW